MQKRLNSWLACYEDFAGRYPAVLMACGVGIVAWLLSWMIFFNPDLLMADVPVRRYPDLSAQCINPFERHLMEPFLAYRLTVPVIGWLLGLRGFAVLTVQHIAVVAVLACIYLAVRKRTGRSSFGLLACLIMSFTFVAQWSENYIGSTDSVSHFCTGLCLLFDYPAALALLTVAGAMNDERFILAIPFIVFWHGDLSDFAAFIKSTWRLMAGFAVGILLVACCRYALASGLIGPGIPPPEAYTQMNHDVIQRFTPWESSWSLWALNFFMAFRWAWLFLVWFLFVRREQLVMGPAMRVFFGLCVAGGTLSTILVGDVSKSIGYLFPAIVLGMTTMGQIDKEKTQRWMTAICGLMILTPTIFFIGTWSQRLRPYPVEFVRQHYILHRAQLAH